MGMKISFNIAKLKDDLRAKADVMNNATRPAAQAGVQIIYDRARELVPVSKEAHKFYGQNAVYGPYDPGNLRDAIYQVFSNDRSFKDVSVYHISWNADKAPYGGMVEFGTVHAPAHSFIAASVVETRSAVRKAIKQRYIEEVTK